MSRSTTISENDLIREIHKFIRGGQLPAAFELLRGLESRAARDARLLHAAAECYTHCAKHLDAYRCNARAAELLPEDSKSLYNLAASAVAIGRIEDAESTFSRVIAQNPFDADAWYNRSTLRHQTPANNHVEDLTRMLASVPAGSPAEVALCHALAKELEDIGEYRDSFRFLQRGAQARRRLLQYRVELDLEAIEAISAAFDVDVLRSAPVRTDAPGPIFILGMPRSGTTLADRILSSHSAVESLGEINDFAYAVMDAAGAATSKLDLIRRSARANFSAMGVEYLRRTAGYGSHRVYLIDKTPLNYLYLGLIHLALPNAKIVHLRRDPMDSGYAMFKTLFRMGYPFSYDLVDLGRYLVAYHTLMQHWTERLAPGAFLEVQYEELVTSSEAVSRRLLEYCGLSWEPQCATSHLNASPAATASAAQVREPIHTRSVGRWRQYQEELEPLADVLRRGGVLQCDAS